MRKRNKKIKNNKQIRTKKNRKKMIKSLYNREIVKRSRRITKRLNSQITRSKNNKKIINNNKKKIIINSQRLNKIIINRIKIRNQLNKIKNQ